MQRYRHMFVTDVELTRPRHLRQLPDVTEPSAATERVLVVDDEPDIVALKLGADDYLTKPVSPPELVLRSGAILRRVKAGRDESQDQKQAGPVELQKRLKTIRVADIRLGEAR